ncbi:MAG: molybdenum ABC transporter ATP-binding protein [Rhodobacteraceae bacterium]|nr:molybdenum ABC transporter ATP-binding protein [Paracoccaceae bacterium]
MMLKVALAHRFGDFALDVAFDAPPGITVLFGRSGSGKSTIVNAIAGLLAPQRGRITLGERVLLDTETRRVVPPHRRKLGVVFQEGRLFPHLTVRQNLSYARWFSRDPAETTEGARIVEMLGIGHLLDRRPAGLSGGEKQRVAIGRSLLARPELILADEPLSSLDDARKAEILPYFERLRDEIQVPILYVSHSAVEVARLATTVIALQDGRIARQGRALEVLGDPMVTPAGVRAAGAVLEAVIVAQHGDGLTELDAGGARLFLPRVPGGTGNRLRVRIPAQDVLLSRAAPEGLSALNILPGTVDQLRQGTGPGVMVSLRTRAGPLLARITRRSAERLELAPGVDVHAVVKTIAIAREDVSAGAPAG